MKDIKRFLWADTIRVFAIYLVVATHLTYLPQKVDISGFFYFLYFAFTRICIPLFVMLSGALLLSKKESHSTFFFKRISRLVGPWIFWSVIFFIVRDTYLVNVHDVPSFIKAFTATMESFWFLPLIVSLYLITPALRVFVQNARLSEVIYVVFLWFLVVSLLPYLRNSQAFPLFTDNGLLKQVSGFFGYFLLGYVLIWKRFSRQLLLLGILAITCGVLWVFYTVIAAKTMSSQQVIYLFDFISPGVIFLATGIFILILYFEKKFDKKVIIQIRRFLAQASAAALGIYFVHGFVWQILSIKFPLKGYPSDLGIFSSLFIFSVSFGIIFTLRQIPLLKKLVS